MKIDADWCIQQSACYTKAKLEALFDRPHTLLEVLTRDDGSWAHVSPGDRIWVFWLAATEAQCKAVGDKIATRAVTNHALTHPVTKAWAKKWLSGEDRSLKSASAAQVLVKAREAREAREATVSSDAWAKAWQARAAWAATCAAEAWAKAWEAKEAKATTCASEAWAKAREARAAWAAACAAEAWATAWEEWDEELRLQVSDCVDVLTKETE